MSPQARSKQYRFRPYRPGKTLVPITCVTPDDGFYIHTFFDVCPFSPSQRYLAVTRLPFQNRVPRLGETADVCVIDLYEQKIETVYRTKGWGMQLGANLHWGVTDRYLYTNDVIGKDAVCVQIDLETRQTKPFVGPKYDIAPDESCAIGFPLCLLNATQRGYGVPKTAYLPPGASTSEGLWRTDLKTNTKSLLVSVADVVAHTREHFKHERGTFYFFHSKFNRQGTRIIQVLRYLVPRRKLLRRVLPGRGLLHRQLFTFDANGDNIQQAVRAEDWDLGGHHPNWHPDGERIIMNLKPDGRTLRFCQFKYNGSEFTVLSEKHLGSGHPSIEAGGRYLVSDCYVKEPMALENREVPIRLLDLTSDEEEYLCTVDTLGLRGVLRLDPHPVWSRDYKQLCFNAALNGKRQVFIADLSNLI